jgi:capsular polysaccharide transport system permease protein
MSNDDRIREWREKRLLEAAKAKQERIQRSKEDSKRRSELTAAERQAKASEQSARRAEVTAMGLPSPRSINESLRIATERRRGKMRGQRLRLLVFLGLPLALFVIYALLLTKPLYEAQSTFVVSSAQSGQGGGAGGLPSLLGGTGALSDEYQLRQFLTSRSTMQYMEKEYGMLSHFEKAGTANFKAFNSLVPNSSDPLDRYQSWVKVTVDLQEGLAALHVQAATRNDAVRFSQGLFKLARQHIANISKLMDNDQNSTLRQEVEIASDAVNDTGREIGAIQQARGEVDPALATTGIYEFISKLELQLSEAQAQRSALRSRDLNRSPFLPSLNAQISTLQRQIREQRKRLVGGHESVQQSILQLERATTRKELAVASLQTAIRTLEQARLSAMAHRRYLVLISQPAAPDKPNVGALMRSIAWLILIAFLVAALYWFGTCFWAARSDETIEL